MRFPTRHHAAIGLVALLALVTGEVRAQKADPAGPFPTIAGQVEGLERREGLLTLHLDGQRGRILLEMPPPADGDEGREDDDD